MYPNCLSTYEGTQNAFILNVLSVRTHLPNTGNTKSKK